MFSFRVIVIVAVEEEEPSSMPRSLVYGGYVQYSCWTVRGPSYNFLQGGENAELPN